MVHFCAMIFLSVVIAGQCLPHGLEQQVPSNENDNWNTLYLTYDELQALEQVFQHEKNGGTSESLRNFGKQKIALVRPKRHVSSQPDDEINQGAPASSGLSENEVLDSENPAGASPSDEQQPSEGEIVLSFIGSPSDETPMMSMSHREGPVNTTANLVNCSLQHSSFDSRGIMQSSPKFFVEMHLPSNFSHSLMWSLHNEFILYQQPEFMERSSICDYNSSLSSSWDASARAACPFRWALGKPNKARIPERLMEAKCSCRKAHPIYRRTSNCRVVKRKIPVLWRTGCKNNQHVYRQGYEEIAVACEPTGYLFQDGVASNSGGRPEYSA